MLKNEVKQKMRQKIVNMNLKGLVDSGIYESEKIAIKADQVYIGNKGTQIQHKIAIEGVTPQQFFAEIWIPACAGVIAFSSRWSQEFI